HRYLQRRRVERAMFLLRTTALPVTEICFRVGFGSVGTFGRTFHAITGRSPSDYREQGPVAPVPTCFTMAWTRPWGEPVARPESAGPRHAKRAVSEKSGAESAG